MQSKQLLTHMKATRIMLVLATGLFLQTMAFGQAKKDKDIPAKQETPVKAIERVVGTWKATHVYNGKKEIGSDTTGMQWVEFKPDGKYATKSKGKSGESGSYRLNENQSRLYLESEVNKDPIEWTITFKENTMTLVSNIGHDKNQQMRYVFVKTKEGLGTNQ